jgi:hypothetical protein
MEIYYTYMFQPLVAETCSSSAVCVVHFHTLRCTFFGFDVMSKALYKGIRLEVIIGTKMLIVTYNI